MLRKYQRKNDIDAVNVSKLTSSFEHIRKVRSTSKRINVAISRKFSNLSLVRSPVSPSKKENLRIFPCSPVTSLKETSKSWLTRIRASSPNSYFNSCRQALDSLTKTPHPVSQVLKHIQKAFNEKLPPSPTPTTPSILLQVNTPLHSQKSIKNRIQMRRFSSKNNFLPNARDGKIGNGSIPRLKISNIGVKTDTAKPTGTTNETSKYKIQDYQDEFMSKFPEFSESWRQQILQQSSHIT